MERDGAFVYYQFREKTLDIALIEIHSAFPRNVIMRVLGYNEVNVVIAHYKRAQYPETVNRAAGARDSENDVFAVALISSDKGFSLCLRSRNVRVI